MSVLVTGGAGYIGSHAARALLEAGRRVVIVDDLSRGHRAAIDRLRSIAPDDSRLAFHQCSILDGQRMGQIIRDERIEVIMHFAAFAYVGESVEQPLMYYRTNASGTLSLLEACRETDVRSFILSSTCATYGEPDEAQIPITEDCPQNPVNPYGWAKLLAERMVLDEVHARRKSSHPLRAGILRYFNVAGCDRKRLLGVDHDPETRIIPIILRTLLGQREHVSIYGTDYDTPDGTCIRDYIHPDDLASAHLAVLNALAEGQDSEPLIFNLGIGEGYSVREVIEATERVTGKDVPVVYGDRRPGDPPILTADVSKIQESLGWSASVTSIDEIIESMWNWFCENEGGYHAL